MQMVHDRPGSLSIIGWEPVLSAMGRAEGAQPPSVKVLTCDIGSPRRFFSESIKRHLLRGSIQIKGAPSTHLDSDTLDTGGLTRTWRGILASQPHEVQPLLATGLASL